MNSLELAKVDWLDVDEAVDEEREPETVLLESGATEDDDGRTQHV